MTYIGKLFSMLAKKFVGTSVVARMGIRTGLTRLDRTTRGLHKGKLYVVGARPGEGKTSFATTLAANVLKFQSSHAVLFISTELDEQEIMLQIAEAYSDGVPVYPNGRQSSESECRRLNVSLDEIAVFEEHGTIQVVHQRSVTIEDLEGWVNLMSVNEDDQVLLIIDQASRIKRNDEHGRRAYSIATEEMLNQIEQLAHKTNASVVLLTQLNRGVERDKTRNLSHLKHSGAFEEFAHCVLLLEKSEGNGKHVNGSAMVHHDAVIHVAKNRHGVVGPIECSFRGEAHTWTEKEG